MGFEIVNSISNVFNYFMHLQGMKWIFFLLTMLNVAGIFSQSKKVQIQILTYKVDSLQEAYNKSSKSYSDSIHGQRIELDDKNQKISHLNAKINQKDKDIKTLTNQITLLNENMKALQRELNAKTREIKILNSRLEKKKTERKSQTDSNEGLNIDEEIIVVDVYSPPPPPKDNETKIEEVIDFPDVEPSFKGGEEAMQIWVQQNLKYPEISMEMGDQGRVFLQFVVEKDGRITDVKVLKSVSKELDKEAIRLVIRMQKSKGGPGFIPGEVNGLKVRSPLTLPINFELN